MYPLVPLYPVGRGGLNKVGGVVFKHFWYIPPGYIGIPGVYRFRVFYIFKGDMVITNLIELGFVI